MLEINEEPFQKIIHEIPKMISQVKKLKCKDKNCAKIIISNLERIREEFLDAIEETSNG